MIENILKNKTLILFDGICILCNKYILFIAKNDRSDNFRFMSIQNIKIKELEKYSSLDITNINSICVITKGKLNTKSKAVLLILSKLRFPYNLGMIFFVIPNIIRDLFYDLIAKNRYNLFGKTEHCSLLKNQSDILKNKLIE